MAGGLPTERAVGSEQPGIQQAPHAHEGLLLHPVLIAPVPVNTESKHIYTLNVSPYPAPFVKNAQPDY